MKIFQVLSIQHNLREKLFLKILNGALEKVVEQMERQIILFLIFFHLSEHVSKILFLQVAVFTLLMAEVLEEIFLLFLFFEFSFFSLGESAIFSKFKCRL